MNKSQNLVVMWQEQTVKIWRLLKRKLIDESDDEEDERMEDADAQEEDEANYKETFELAAKLTLADDENITSVALSQDGTILAVGRLTTTKLFKLSPKSNSSKLKVSKIDEQQIQAQGSKHLLFNGSDSLILTTPDNEIYRFNLDEESTDEQVIEYELSDLPRSKSKLPYIENINHIKLTHNNEKLVVSRVSGAIDLIDLNNSDKIESTPFLRLSSYINRIEVSLKNTLIVITHENKIYEFDLNNESNSAHLTNWSKINSEFLPKQFTSLQESPLDPKRIRKRNRHGVQIGVNEDIAVEDEGLDESDDEQQIENELLQDQVTRLLERNDFIKEVATGDEDKNGVPFAITRKYKPILYANSLLNEGEIIVIERPQFALSQPPAFKLNQIRV
ncbi:unnamed protein product [Wickerhamomyces anomalus]